MLSTLATHNQSAISSEKLYAVPHPAQPQLALQITQRFVHCYQWDVMLIIISKQTCCLCVKTIKRTPGLPHDLAQAVWWWCGVILCVDLYVYPTLTKYLTATGIISLLRSSRRSPSKHRAVAAQASKQINGGEKRERRERKKMSALQLSFTESKYIWWWLFLNRP